MEVQDVIGLNVRLAREQRDMTQAELGDALAPLLGKGLMRQAVSVAESGGRSFTAIDMAALAIVLDRPVSWFYIPPAGPENPVTFPTGEKRPGEQIAGAVTDVERAAQIAAAAGSIDGHLREIEEQVESVRSRMMRLTALGMRGDA